MEDSALSVFLAQQDITFKEMFAFNNVTPIFILSKIPESALVNALFVIIPTSIQILLLNNALPVPQVAEYAQVVQSAKSGMGNKPISLICGKIKWNFGFF
jgi:hypothetical protein